MIWNDSMVRTRFVAIVASLGVLAAGCTHSPAADHTSASPQPLTSASPSPSPTRSGPLSTGPGVLPGEKPPVLSADAKKHTPAGALYFAAYYIKALDWSFATNDPYLLKAISSPTCPACNRYIAALDGLGQGEHLTGSRITIVSEQVVSGSFKVKSDVVVEFVLDDQAGVLVDPSSAPRTVAPAANNDKSFVFVSWLSGVWKVVDEGAPS